MDELTVMLSDGEDPGEAVLTLPDGEQMKLCEGDSLILGWDTLHHQGTDKPLRVHAEWKIRFRDAILAPSQLKVNVSSKHKE